VKHLYSAGLGDERLNRSVLTVAMLMVLFSAAVCRASEQTALLANADKSAWTEDESNANHGNAKNGAPSVKANPLRQAVTVPLSGSATSFSHAEKDFEVGVRALDARLYGEAQVRLSRALYVLNKTREGANLRAPAHLTLAEAYLGLDNLEKAQLNLEEAKSMCLSSPDAAVKARYFADLAEQQLADGHAALAAENAASQSVQILEKSGASGKEIAYAHALLGRTLFARAYYDEAKAELKKALAILELEPGRDRLTYAGALEGLAMIEHKLGEEAESAATMKTAISLKDDAVTLNKTPDQKGLVKYDWTEGIYGSRQIVDPVYPLKYMVVGGVRVACTLVRSYKHLAVLISLANCTKQPISLSVGAVDLVKIVPGRKSMVFCDPGLIDEVLEEDVILDRTWRRQTLCHIEKTRTIPGYLKNGVLDADDFFGNNEWGLYGAWDSHLRDAPPIVTREQFFYDERPKSADQEILGFMRGNAQVRPTYIETGGARSGVVFFLRDRYEDALVRLFIGNAELRFPFHVTAGQ